MTNEFELQQLKDQLEKMKFHINLIGETINYEKYPIPSLVIDLNWSSNDLNIAYNIFEDFEKRINHGETSLLHIDMQVEFEEKLNVNYQELKLVVLSFFYNNQFTEVCIEYAKSFGNSIPIEIKCLLEKNS